MFGDTDLPLALIMEEILGWEKKPGEKDEEEKENTQLSSTSKKSTHNFHQLPKSLEHKKRSRREDFTSSSDFLI